ncbi:hypothetical protein [Streptomyces marianii]|uniref:CobQ/CobB/MinD/ParA nucleotide binding domain-containing protein n=1 Tax=Streptomyces marianii TaxID=1817406 RepID=A0A5R9DTY5_9ACTN|nr:hypothetical protein [Streptomyces marianii]TLQ39231.1 hypothetical protein FEF34_38180 [Streptomyces marianii]
MSRDSNTIRLRQQYTGEPRQAAHAFYQARGLHFGLVPDAADPQQQLLEAAVMLTLARPRLPQLAEEGPRFGLRGVSPDVDRLVLWPDPACLPRLLARLLPTRTAAGIAGVAGLRVSPPAGRTDTLLLARPGHSAHLAVRARRRDLTAAEEWAEAAGLEPLWTSRTPHADEHEAWNHLVGSLPTEERTLWSRALRRIALQPAGSRHWAERPPTRQELDGPSPHRIEPRNVGPAGGLARGVIAVTSSRGQAGLGCTTAALALADALARTGARVAFFGTGTEDPNGLAYLLRDELPPPGVLTDIADDLPGRGALRAMTLPPDPARARELLAEASRSHDMVVLDAGAAFQMRYLVEHADAVIALAPYQPDVWGHTEDTARLLQFLDAMFAAYVEDRTEIEDYHQAESPDVYVVAEDRNDAESWWAEYTHIPPVPDDWPRLPAESATPHLTSWRRDFLGFLHAEGRRRHPATWDAATAVWADRNRARNTRGLQPDEDPDDLGAYLGKHDIRTVRHTADPEAVTAWLLGQFDHLVQARPTLLLSRVPEEIDQHQLTEVRERLREHGIPDTVVCPELDDLRELPFIVAGAVTGWDEDAAAESRRTLSDEAAAAASRLALVVAGRLHTRAEATE